MRLFVAAEIPDELREAVERDTVAPLRDHLPGARWTSADGRHLTVKFLGNVADERVADVAGAVSSAVAGHAPFEVSLNEVGAFPSLRRPRVLWIGLGAGGSDLASIAGDLDTAFERLGFAAEKRPFRCHLTLARFKTPHPVEIPAVAVPATPFLVREVVLFRSHLHPKGARYEAVRRFSLAG